jgi:hypothetical protein
MLVGVAQQQVSTGPFTVTVPRTWNELRRKQDLVILRSPDQRQQVTVSLAAGNSPISFEIFAILCEDRLEVERRELQNGFITPDSPRPFVDCKHFAFTYSGGERSANRLFSFYMTASGNDAFMLYLEGIGVSPKDQLATFQQLVKSIRGR